MRKLALIFCLLFATSAYAGNEIDIPSGVVSSVLNFLSNGETIHNDTNNAYTFLPDSTGSTLLILQDFDASARDSNFILSINATDAANGTEDIDVVFQAQVAGAGTNFLVVDADLGLTLGSATQTHVTLLTDDTGDGTDLVIPANGVDASELNGANVCGAMFHASVNPTEAGATDDFMSLQDHSGSTTEGDEDDFFANSALLTFHSLRCDVATAPGAGNDDWRIVMRDDGADTTVTCDIAETATGCEDTANSTAVAPGSNLNFDINSDIGGGADPTAAALITCSVCMGP